MKRISNFFKSSPSTRDDVDDILFFKPAFDKDLEDFTPIKSLNQDLQENIKSKKTTYLQIAGTTIIGIGTGVAMMPIFNYQLKNLKDYGIDVKGNETSFIISTINTLIATSTIASVGMFKIISERSTEPNEQLTTVKKIIMHVGRFAGLCSTALPVALLWEVELNNQKIAGSHGFDKFIAWAAASTIPLLIYNSADSIDSFNEFVKGKVETIDLNSTGSASFVYGTSLLSAAGRFICYTNAGITLCKAIGFNDDISLTLGLTLGGVMGSSVIAMSEHLAIKSLFKVREEAFTLKEIAIAGLSTLEGAWFTFPLVTFGMNYTLIKDIHPFLKGALFTPFAVSHTIQEATRFYDNLSYLIFSKPKQKDEEVNLATKTNYDYKTFDYEISSTIEQPPEEIKFTGDINSDYEFSE